MRARRSHRLASTPALWLGEQGATFGYQGAARMLARRAQEAGLGHAHWHQLRHSFASSWLRAGGSETGLMAAAGWSDHSMVARYSADTQQARAIEETQRLGLDDF